MVLNDTGGRLSVETSRDESRIVISFAGELDVATGPYLVDTLDLSLSADAAMADEVVVDLTGTTFMDPAGYSALVECHRLVCEAGGWMVVQNPFGEVARLLWLIDEIGRPHRFGIAGLTSGGETGR